MATNMISAALDAVTTKKGAAIAGVAMLGLAALINIGQSPSGASAVDNKVQGVISAPPNAAPVQVAAAAVATGPFDKQQVDAIQTIVRNYLLKNPEIMIDVTRELEARQKERQEADQLKLIASSKATLFSSPLDYVAGNTSGDVTVVEFSDYNCGWCKRAVNEVVKLIAKDSKVRVVMKEFPIFGEASTMAAKAAMASNKQGKYWPYHLALMKQKQVGPQNIFVIAKQVGLDVERLKKDMNDPKIEAALKDTHQIAQGLKIEGTPGFIVDSKVNVGFLTVDGLERLVAEVRKSGCKMC